MYALAAAYRAKGRRVGILAVDPTSPLTGGALLGDRIRMQELHADPDVFIRSMATRGRLGGLAPATGDLVLLLDAAGYDIILVETVGVGQDEIDIARLADITLVVLAPGMGDEVQAIKAGIMEIADIFLLNKADLPGIDKLEREVQFLVSLTEPRGAWSPPVLRCIATEGAGAAEVLEAIEQFTASRTGASRAVRNWESRLLALYRERVVSHLDEAAVRAAAEAVAARRSDPYTVIEQWLKGEGKS